MRKRVLAAAALVMILTSHGAGAQEALSPAQRSQPQQTCLQNNRIWSWNAVNDRLLIVTDVTYHQFIVRLGGGCIGLSAYPLTALRFHTWTRLGCLQRGDDVSYDAPALGRLTCFINEVQPYSDALLTEAKEQSRR